MGLRSIGGAQFFSASAGSQQLFPLVPASVLGLIPFRSSQMVEVGGD